MQSNLFKSVASTESNLNLIKRQYDIYKRPEDIRTEFGRDYTRILHSLAYRRLKHKTQVFFNIDNDHICTRMEHVQHVESVSYTIASYLGLNTELTKAIATAHDLGHAPFGHYGEVILTEIRKKHNLDIFWHEKNGLYFADNIELLRNQENIYKNMNLTYAVRDGIISHCGEIDENRIVPRTEYIDLKDFKKGKYQPYTWEGCVVKISDKIAYLGRDIEDAIRLNLLSNDDKNQLNTIADKYNISFVNSTVLIYNFIIDICKNSTVYNGICLSDNTYNLMNEIKDFNYNHIYNNSQFDHYKEYVKLIINRIFDELFSLYDGKDTINSFRTKNIKRSMLSNDFSQWIINYCNLDIIDSTLYQDVYSDIPPNNIKIYKNLEDSTIYANAILDYISGMTDKFAISSFNELLKY